MRHSTLFNLHVHDTNAFVSKPRFSWNTTSRDTQTSYRIKLFTSQNGDNHIWDSGVVSSPSSLVEYAGPLLSPGTQYFWTVDIETTAGSAVVASSAFITNYSPFQDSSHQIGKRQVSDFGTLTTAFKTGTWIWTADGSPPLFLAPPGDRFFRRTYTPPVGKTAVLAEVIITADNKFSLFVNGALVGVSPADVDSWQKAQGYRMALNPGQVVFAVAATNAPTATGAANAAGLLVAIRITHSDATQVLIGSDKQWVSNILAVPAFQQPATDDSAWVPATLLAKFSSGPWALSVTLPTVLATATLPAPSTSAVLSSTTSISSTSSSLPLSSSTTSLPPSSTSSSVPATSSSTLTITQTSFAEEATAPTASTSPASTTSSTKPAIIGAILGGVLGAFALLGLGLVFWRRRKREQDELAAADFDTWIPASHTASSGAPSASNPNAPFMSQTPGSSRSPAPPSTLRQPEYGNAIDQYAQQTPYRYPPPSAMLGAASTEQYGDGYGVQAARYGARVGGTYGNGDSHGPSGYAATQDYGSNTQLVPSQPNSGTGSIPPTLLPRAEGYYSPEGQNSNGYHHRYH
ncbi:hypothetical protein H0H87_006049 [Tephrocybe sp. NHM501043]|nr:hypothetical protein H0H87_006049 [Tephrocybe sp. NHM501043]